MKVSRIYLVIIWLLGTSLFLMLLSLYPVIRVVPPNGERLFLHLWLDQEYFLPIENDKVILPWQYYLRKPRRSGAVLAIVDERGKIYWEGFETRPSLSSEIKIRQPL
jgi:hypothetical protein